jgi:hypothetical protein
MKSFIRLVNISFLSFLIILSSHAQQINKSSVEINIVKTTKDSAVICFISDTQEPMWIEKMIYKYNHNNNARKVIFNKILEMAPNAVFHLGDIVAMGSSKSEWARIDTFVNKLKLKDIPFYPIPGNHEYLFFSKSGMNNFTKRYPYASITGYSKVIANTAVVLFNSNFNKLTKKQFNRQLEWYKSTLKHYQSDSLISFILVGCHHSPFTNSKVVSPSKGVQKYFLPDFYKTSKCKLFISGHAHAFEHFKIKGKDFLVIGGGGGIQQELYTGSQEKYKDLFDSSSEKRMFHFITINIDKDKLIIRLEMLNKDFKTFNNSYKFILNRF